MGCGNSKLNANGSPIPQRFRPIFQGRLDEIRRKHAGKFNDDDQTSSSKKVLLLHEDDYDVSIHQQNLVKRNAANAVNRGGESLSSSADDSVSSEGSKGDEANSTREKNNRDNGGRVENGEGKLMDAKKVNDGDDDEDDVGYNDDDERTIKRRVGNDDDLPSSPSFRVFFLDNVQDHEKKNDGYIPDKENNGVKETTVIKETASSQVIAPFEESAPKKAKKESKKENFRKALQIRPCYARKG